MAVLFVSVGDQAENGSGLGGWNVNSCELKVNNNKWKVICQRYDFYLISVGTSSFSHHSKDMALFWTFSHFNCMMIPSNKLLVWSETVETSLVIGKQLSSEVADCWCCLFPIEVHLYQPHLEKYTDSVLNSHMKDIWNKLTKLRRHASREHFAKIHFG